MENNDANIPEDARVALEKFKEEARAVADEILKTLEKSPDSQAVFHYTDDIGLRGILHGGKLWLTDVFSLNDPSELFHGLKLAFRILIEKATESGRTPEGDIDRLKEAFQNSAHCFCCSFSEAADELGQWRAYADDGKGYAIGFDWQALEAIFLGTYSANFLVSYDEQDLRGGIDRIFKSYSALVKLLPSIEFQEEEYERFGRRVHEALAGQMIRMSLLFKHPAYLNEAEWRLLMIQKSSDPDGILYRPRKYDLIKYKEFDWRAAGSSVLKEIVIGPAANFEKSKRFAEDCLREAGIDAANIEIRQSEIPYKPA